MVRRLKLSNKLLRGCRTWRQSGKKAIRNKRKYAVQFAKKKKHKREFELKKYRKIASKDRREAITAYWGKKSAELHENPSAFYKTFQPFINAKSKESPDICLRTSDGSVTSNQTEAT